MFEKAIKFFSKGWAPFISLMIAALGIYLKWEFEKEIWLFASPAIALAQLAFARKAKATEHIYWQDVYSLSNIAFIKFDLKLLAEDNLPVIKMANAILEVSVQFKEQNGFFSHKFKNSTIPGKNETTSAHILLTEADPKSLHTQWWQGKIFKVGQYTKPDGQYFAWFTADLNEFLKKHPIPEHLKKKES